MKNENNLLSFLGNEVSAQTAEAFHGIGNIDASIGYFISDEPYVELFYKQEEDFAKNAARIKGKDVAIVQSGSGDVTANSFHLLEMVHTLRKYGVGTVTVVMPFAPLGRQDRAFENRFVSLGAEFYATQLKSAGADRVITVTPHSGANITTFKKYFGRNFTALETTELFAQDMIRRFGGIGNLVVGAPDGADKPSDEGQARARKLCVALLEPAFDEPSVDSIMFKISKQHTGVNSTEIMGFAGNVKGCDAVIIDDMIDGGGTMLNAARRLKAEGARSVTCYATHAVLSASQDKVDPEKIVTALEKLLMSKGAENAIDKIVLTDSMPTNVRTRLEQLAKDHPELSGRVEVLLLGKMIRETLENNPRPHLTWSIALRKVKAFFA